MASEHYQYMSPKSCGECAEAGWGGRAQVRRAQGHICGVVAPLTRRAALNIPTPRGPPRLPPWASTIDSGAGGSRAWRRLIWFFLCQKKTQKTQQLHTSHPLHPPLAAMRHKWHPGSGTQHTSYSTHASTRTARSTARGGLLFTDQLGGLGAVCPNPPFLRLFWIKPKVRSCKKLIAPTTKKSRIGRLGKFAGGAHEREGAGVWKIL